MGKNCCFGRTIFEVGKVVNKNSPFMLAKMQRINGRVRLKIWEREIYFFEKTNLYNATIDKTNPSTDAANTINNNVFIINYLCG